MNNDEIIATQNVQAQQVLTQGVLDIIGAIPTLMVVYMMSNLSYIMTNTPKPQIYKTINKIPGQIVQGAKVIVPAVAGFLG